jgi:predicted Rossmann fold nucleotide-binding protein DprA/Smf involved in DNA uptake
MSEGVRRAETIIRDRLAEIEREQSQLGRALEHLVNERSPTRKRTRRSRTGGKGQVSTSNRAARSAGASKRAKRGQRQSDLLKQLAKTPDAPVSDVARAIGVSASQAHAIARRLEANGQVRRGERGFVRVRAG